MELKTGQFVGIFQPFFYFTEDFITLYKSTKLAEHNTAEKKKT